METLENKIKKITAEFEAKKAQAIKEAVLKDRFPTIKRIVDFSNSKQKRLMLNFEANNKEELLKIIQDFDPEPLYCDENPYIREDGEKGIFPYRIDLDTMGNGTKQKIKFVTKIDDEKFSIWIDVKDSIFGTITGKHQPYVGEYKTVNVKLHDTSSNGLRDYIPFKAQRWDKGSDEAYNSFTIWCDDDSYGKEDLIDTIEVIY